MNLPGSDRGLTILRGWITPDRYHPEDWLV